MIQQGDVVVALWIRPGGRIENLLEQQLEKRSFATRIWLPDSAQLIPQPCRRRWLQTGAQLFPIPSGFSNEAFTFSGLPCGEFPQCLTLDQFDPNCQWLVHCTRATDRRRVSESRIDFLIRWLETPTAFWGDSLASLNSILAMRMLRPNAGSIRSEAPVVCLSALRLPQLVNRREYRRGRMHWDYEPYGIAFPMTESQQIKAQPVHYGGESDWANLPPRLQPWFQPRYSGSKCDDSTTNGKATCRDWSQEAEWRVAGPIRLESLPIEGWIPFVSSRKEIQRLNLRGVHRVLCLTAGS